MVDGAAMPSRLALAGHLETLTWIKGRCCMQLHTSAAKFSGVGWHRRYVDGDRSNAEQHDVKAKTAGIQTKISPYLSHCPKINLAENNKIDA